MGVYLPIKDYSAMQGPAPDGFHIPLSSEWQGLKTIMDGLSLTTSGDWRINLHLPLAGRLNTSASTNNQGVYAYYWSSSPYSSAYPYLASSLLLWSSISTNSNGSRAEGRSVRCFNNSFITPTSSWTVITGTLGGAGIFRNQTEGLISITSDGTTGYTIQDKNLGATTVYNDGDTLSEANCGKYYQWGNNYGFLRTGDVTTSSTQVNASAYGPGNYYSSSTFITGSTDRSSVHNDNLWGGVTGVKPMSDLKNAYIGEYRVPGENTIAYYPLKSDILDYSDNNNNFTGGTYTFSDNFIDVTTKLTGPVTLPNGGTGPRTISMWTCVPSGDTRAFSYLPATSDGGPNCYISGRDTGNGNRPGAGFYYNGWKRNRPASVSVGEKFLMTWVKEGATMKLYLNAVLVSTTNLKSGGTWNLPGPRAELLPGKYSEIIVEDQTRDTTMISEYYNLTKSNYGL